MTANEGPTSRDVMPGATAVTFWQYARAAKRFLQICGQAKIPST
jgi:hypothetical protein